ncbi:hypothetical protein H4R33_003269 [Dimargaris cristalligena]|uniref:Exonuclease domain-containing protein n=1 Tax=Dimargaris cristalligena TaxID=215637 RepID=A0A4Q0A2R1_9FUNG|nr:hypothetical protein H4R33_003269 [Dimargaris cristalligena]RKP40403.1 hypothetical protein BJ085DRAFT_36953 [Dimargaris cristalligena]|eukprot:RKP40403.1 hypothetical protein BJ085DRAFT_36953 [Dimargaris cristalligena]
MGCQPNPNKAAVTPGPGNSKRVASKVNRPSTKRILKTQGPDSPASKADRKTDSTGKAPGRSAKACDGKDKNSSQKKPRPNPDNPPVVSEQQLAGYRSLLKNTLKMVDDGKHTILCLDIEAYEHDQNKLTEVGWCMYDPVTRQITTRHIIIKETIKLYNGRFVADNKHRFNFGKSQVMPRYEGLMELHAAVTKAYPIAFLGHDVASDIKFLKSEDMHLHHSVPRLDTKALYCAHTKNPRNGRRLAILLEELGIEYSHLHNAGNDAHYTMLVFLKIMEQNRLDSPDQPN